LSALIAGFALIVQTNVSLDDATLNPYLLYALAATTAVVISLMLFAMVKATLLLIAVYRYNYDGTPGEEWRKTRLRKIQVEVELRLLAENGTDFSTSRSASSAASAGVGVGAAAAALGVKAKDSVAAGVHPVVAEEEGGVSSTLMQLLEERAGLDERLEQTAGRASALRHWAFK
jgi:hypothetical protein